MKQRVQQAIRDKIVRHVRSRYELIKPAPTQGLFNFRCFENAVEYQRLNPNLEIFEVMGVDDGDPFLHYINFDPEAGEFLETSLGWRAETMEYYVIRPIHPSDYRYIHREFNRACDSWRDQFTNWFHRKVLRIDRVV